MLAQFFVHARRSPPVVLFGTDRALSIPAHGSPASFHLGETRLHLGFHWEPSQGASPLHVLWISEPLFLLNLCVTTPNIISGPPAKLHITVIWGAFKSTYCSSHTLFKLESLGQNPGIINFSVPQMLPICSQVSEGVVWWMLLWLTLPGCSSGLTLPGECWKCPPRPTHSELLGPYSPSNTWGCQSPPGDLDAPSE